MTTPADGAMAAVPDQLTLRFEEESTHKIVDADLAETLAAKGKNASGESGGQKVRECQWLDDVLECV